MFAEYQNAYEHHLGSMIASGDKERGPAELVGDIDGLWAPSAEQRKNVDVPMLDGNHERRIEVQILPQNGVRKLRCQHAGRE